jgi:hypothetical protein
MPEQPIDRSLVIVSPMVGTYYASSTPDTTPFISVGSAVRPDTIVCIIEAMRVFTDIPAGIPGTIVEVLVQNGQMVEYGQPLFRIKIDGRESIESLPYIEISDGSVVVDIYASARDRSRRLFGG